MDNKKLTKKDLLGEDFGMTTVTTATTNMLDIIEETGGGTLQLGGRGEGQKLKWLMVCTKDEKLAEMLEATLAAYDALEDGE